MFYPIRLARPYDVRSLLEVYLRTQRKDLPHPDFATYYARLLAKLEAAFEARLDVEALNFTQRVLWMLFANTVQSLNGLRTPWSGFGETGLIHEKLRLSGAPGEAAMAASARITDAFEHSRAAHYEMLLALFRAMFGERGRVVTSEDLKAAGLDDAEEPDIANYDEWI